MVSFHPFLALSLVTLSACHAEDSFEERFERESQEMERRGAEIERVVANDMAAAREAEQARNESEEMAEDK